MASNKFSFDEQKVITKFVQLDTCLDAHIGRSVKYINPTCIIEHETFVIRHIQKNWKGDLAYNLVCITGESAGSLSAEFGRCCNPSEVYFIDEIVCDTCGVADGGHHAECHFNY